ncbi:MAG: hypothetical protein K8J08_14830 [Thermoanaerobaculia bacterium]|nr:hypothetical protein [Thermoanaerobaculia bacterium]
MIDIHCHVLPGVDDGVPDLAAARALCERAAEDGTTDIIATPHQRHPNWPNEDRGYLETVWRGLREHVGDLLEIHLGAEVRLDSHFLDELERRQSGHVLPLAGSRYLLIELPRAEVGPYPEDVLHEVSIAGYFPILAHPEMIPYLSNDLDRLESFVADGAMLQVTAMSVTGEFGRVPEQAAWSMLREGWVHFVASDAHSAAWRPPGLSSARAALTKQLGVDVASLLTQGNPARILENLPLTLKSEPE